VRQAHLGRYTWLLARKWCRGDGEWILWKISEVVFLLNRIPAEKIETGARHPRGRADWPRMGIFAQRSKDRPNIGITVCQIEPVDGLRIRVRELDAVDAAPVLDVKPYLKGFAPRGEVREPPWAAELMAGYFRKI
jgi:tRNA (adenine37-N6)-methyltransferase